MLCAVLADPLLDQSALYVVIEWSITT